MSGEIGDYNMNDVQPIGAGIYADAPQQSTDVQSTPVTTGQLVVPRTDHLPVLPDAGGVTDIVSETTDAPWFADSTPDLREQAYEKATC